MACLGFLLCLWEPVQAALLGCLGTAVADSLTSLRDRAVAAVRDLTFFWGNQVEPINTSTAHLVGLEEIHGYLEKIAGYLKDDAVGIIGIYGMGGVGKTTLLETINNDFHKIGAPRFDVVIWVTVSQDASILKIQKLIGGRLGLSLSADTEGSSSKAEEQARGIFQALFKRRFLLLLDNVWDELDLEHVGIPHPTAGNKCKIILTTRSRRVCINMGAEKLVTVNILNASESWKLFKEKLGTEVDSNDPRINPLARAIADKCGGLPLALITVGRAMAEATSVDEWEEALEQLRKTPHKLPGMEDKVLSLLKFSFDRLGDETTRQCLLYCCLFPEDHEIPVDKVIEYWVGEGFLDDTQSESIVRARRRGHGVITKLKSACLLETGWIEYSNVACVKMHDVVREMCLWLTGGEFDKSNTFLVYAGSDRVPRSERWGEAKRIALMRNSSQALPHNIPPCPKLRTLLCDRFIRRYAIPRDFFECMPALCVLDLSWCRLKSLPEEISFLAELRYLNLGGNHIRSLPRGLGKLAKLSHLDLSDGRLESLPEEISFLAELGYLNLQGTDIRSLPRGLGKLAKLSQLNLSWCRLESLPEEIGFLAELGYLNLHHTDIRSLPRGLGKLAKLSHLDLSDCRLESLPEEISFLAELGYLNLQGTDIRSLPRGLGKLAKLSHLDLSDCRLESLPEEISFLAELGYLNLQGTDIRSLPRGLGKLAKLSQLNLSWCRLESLPEEIGFLAELGYLNLHHTDIRSLPRGLGKLAKLSHLDLSDCRLESLPEEISFLAELGYLNLQGTDIRSLPRGLGKLAKLSHLDLSDCRLESLPEEISFLAELGYLNLQGTDIRSLPRGLGKLAKLSHLDLSDCRLESLPEEIGFLAELRYLNLQDTDIRSLPRGLGKLAKLSHLDLSDCRLESLPEEIGFLAELRYLNLQDTDIRSLPRGLGKLAKLSHLDLSDCRLESLPEEISFLAELGYLNLQGTNIRSLPRGLGKLAKLSHLDLSDCRLESLPEEIGFLAELRYLNLQHTHIRSLPRGLGKLAKLSELDLSYCRLESLPEEIGFLAELTYLNLQHTHIRSLPRGLGKLAKLSKLDLDFTVTLSHIPREAIPTLTGLRVLGMYESGYNFNLLNDNMGEEDSRSCWDRLEELRLSVRTLSSLEMLLKCDRLCLCTTRLRINFGRNSGITAARVSEVLARLEKVRSLKIFGNPKDSEIQLGIGNRFGSNLQELDLRGASNITVVVSSPCFFESLRQLTIHDCRGIRDLMWVRQLPRLEEIEIKNCEGMEELLPEVNGLEERGVDYEAVDCDRASLLELRRIVLDKLPALKRISARPLLFPGLEFIEVQRCPQLKKLPLGPDSAQYIKRIQGEADWWESLEWHQDADGSSVKSRFLPNYVEKAFERESEEESEESESNICCFVLMMYLKRYFMYM